MTGYDKPDLGDADFELGHELLARCQDRSLVENSPQWHYCTKDRGLPEHAIRYCAQNLRVLDPPIPGFTALCHGIVSLLHNGATDDPVGLAVEACGPAGERMPDPAGRTLRKAFRLQPNGVRDALLKVPASGTAPMIGYLTEGRLAKVIAVAAIFDDPAVYGGGSRGCLGMCAPPEPTIVIVEDARPQEGEQAAAHDRDMARAADRLLLAGKIVQRTGGPRCGCCKDVDQALGKHPLEELRAWINGAQPAALSLDGHARECARIKDPLRRGQAIAEAITKFELRKQGLAAAFRAEVAKYAGARLADEEAEATGTSLDVADVLPWPESVDGAAVLDRTVELLRAHVVMRPHEAYLIALWCVFAHALDCFYFNPRLGLRSPVKRCGKTTMLDIISALVPRALPAANITEAAVFRTIEAAKPTLLIDEADCFIAENAALRSVLNSGHTRTSAHVIRVVPTATGEQEPRKFSTWAPIAIALIGSLPGTLADRSIDIALHRKPRSTRVRRLRKDRGTELPELQRKLARFVADHRLALEQADPEPPEELHDRMADNMRPLMAIAAVTGGHWPARAQAAALELNGTDDGDEDYNVQLLADIRSVFDQRTGAPYPDRIWTDELLAALLAMRERPWPEANQGRGLTARGLVKLLRPFGIAPKQVWKGSTNRRGYALSSFEGVFSRYLSARVLDPKETAASSDFQSARDEAPLADKNGPKPAAAASSSTLADSEPEKAPLEEDIGAASGNGLDPDRPKPKRRSRIKGADTTPDVQGLPGEPAP